MLLGEDNSFLNSLSRKATLLDASNNHPTTTENVFCSSSRAGSTAANSPLGSRQTSSRAPSPTFISHGWSSAETRGLPERRTSFCLQLPIGLRKGGPQPPCLTAPNHASKPRPPPLPTLLGPPTNAQLRDSGQ